jgi:hypothetical protein
MTLCREQGCGQWGAAERADWCPLKGCETGAETPKADPVVSELMPSITKTQPSTRPHRPGDVEATAAHQVSLSL